MTVEERCVVHHVATLDVAIHEITHVLGLLSSVSLSVTLSVGTPLCPYGIAYRRAYDEAIASDLDVAVLEINGPPRGPR